MSSLLGLALLIFNASFLVELMLILEPIINGFWFYLLHKYAHKRFKTSTLAVIYTIGHFTIATSWSFLLLGFALDKAVLDAIIEPLLNGFWFYSLVYIWNTQPKQVTN